MDIGEKIFEKVFPLFKKKKQKLLSSVTLEEMRKRGGVLFHAVISRRFQVSFSDIDWPKEIALFSNQNENEKAWVFRVLVSSVSLRLFLEGDRPDDWFTKACQWLAEEFPGFQTLKTGLEQSLMALGLGFFSPSVLSLLIGPLPPLVHQRIKRTGDKKPGSGQKTEKEREEKVVRAKEVDLTRENENPVDHAFEKMNTADDWSGGKRACDGSDELNDHEKALKELKMDQVVRSSEPTQSVYRAHLIVETENETGEEKGEFAYPEWSYRKQAYLRDWCRMREVDVLKKNGMPAIPVVFTKAELKLASEIRQKFLGLVDKSVFFGRQKKGVDFDWNQLVDRQVALKTGGEATDKIYLDSKPWEHDTRFLFLIDQSLSTDAWVLGFRVFDLLMQSLKITSKALDFFEKQVSFAGFYSQTRRDCVYLKLKDFNESWKVFYKRLPHLAPTGYTRMGAALRHATSVLDKISSRRKILFLLTDAKPTDYDAYEGVYGEADVKKAMQECKARGIVIKGLSLSQKRKRELATIHHEGHFDYYHNINELSDLLSRAYLEALRV